MSEEHDHEEEKHSIFGQKEYIKFIYHFNYFSAYAIISAIYCIPTIIITLKMIYLYVRKHKVLSQNNLHPELFRQFLIMQTLCLFHVFIAFFVIRIPNTGWMTAWCASRKPERILKVLMFLNSGIIYSKYFSIILFCVMRVFLLTTSSYLKEFQSSTYFQKAGLYLTYLTPFLISVAFLLALPRYMENASCSQVGDPFPHGAIMVMSLIRHNAKMPLSFIIEVVINPFVVITISVLNFIMFLKLRESRQLSLITSRKHDSKAEKVFTVTMALLLIPVIINVSIALFEFFDDFLFHVYLIRPYSIDAQAHVITCYFYFTHPIFKKKVINVVRVKSVTTN
ncbi:hypothetical protein CRE_26793 [Caenorhabditis remanei]|uniref:Serpentine Receptor, class U n=1 Tax=Caenorhabditis remanei TaxID=31234 RepID=E3NGC5_CAERE|nr:hypothetical protein CRE_26793 [Caenorhabditis remanei]